MKQSKEKSKEEKLAKYTLITAFISAGASIIALFISVWTTCSSINYSDLSLNPLIQICFDSELGGLYIKNFGNNLAIIDGIEIFKEGKKYVVNNDSNWTNFIKEIKFENEFQFLQIPETYNPVIRANENYCLCGYKKDYAYTTTKNHLKYLLTNCEIQIVYRNLKNKVKRLKKTIQ
jgi:hypothetical protein